MISDNTYTSLGSYIIPLHTLAYPYIPLGKPYKNPTLNPENPSIRGIYVGFGG